MRISKDKSPRPPKGEKASATKQKAATSSSKSGEASAETVEKAEKVDVDAALHEELSGRKATSAHLKAIVERVLGAGDDSNVQLLVKKIASADPVHTAPGYRLDDDLDP